LTQLLLLLPPERNDYFETCPASFSGCGFSFSVLDRGSREPCIRRVRMSGDMDDGVQGLGMQVGSGECRSPKGRRCCTKVTLSYRLFCGRRAHSGQRSGRKVSMVWNDAGTNPLGNILLQSYALVSLAAETSAPVKINNDNVAGALHFLPATRNVDSNGLLRLSTELKTVMLRAVPWKQWPNAVLQPTSSGNV
jgi:hypothetical protein